MARNRKRAKARRPQAAPVAGRGRAQRELAPDGEASPEAIEHATPDVELAEAQLAAGRPDGAIESAADVEEFEQESAAPAPVRAPTERVGLLTRLINFVQGSWRELQRVQWPDRRQVMQATSVVIGFVIVAGVFLGVADLLAGHIMNYILTGHFK